MCTAPWSLGGRQQLGHGCVRRRNNIMGSARTRRRSATCPHRGRTPVHSCVVAVVGGGGGGGGTRGTARSERRPSRRSDWSTAAVTFYGYSRTHARLTNVHTYTRTLYDCRGTTRAHTSPPGRVGSCRVLWSCRSVLRVSPRAVLFHSPPNADRRRSRKLLLHAIT